MEDKNLDSNPDNLDPITREPGSHPVGTGLGSAGGAATGAGIGAVVAGPIGAVIGGALGAFVGGAAGHAAGEAINPTAEREFWSRNFQSRPYYKSGKEYSEYEPAYRFGWESAGRAEYAGKKFDEVEQRGCCDRSVDRCAGCDPRRVAEGSRELKRERRSAWSSGSRTIPGRRDQRPGVSFLKRVRSSDSCTIGTAASGYITLNGTNTP